MAGAAGATPIAAAPFPPAAPLPGKSRIVSSSLPSSFPSRVRRTNHLRQKILKTLENKPYPDTDTSNRKITPISIEESVQKQVIEYEQLTVTETTGFIDEILARVSTKSFGKIGLYLVGAFVFQTICAVVIFGSSNLDDEDDDNLSSDGNKKARVRRLKSEPKSKSEPNLLLDVNRNVTETDEFEMDDRIVEIQQMAREAREIEKMEARRKGLVEEGDDDVDIDIDHDLIDKTVKEKEVDARLMKLRKSLEGDYEKPPLKFPTNEGGEGVSVANQAFDSLMFKKKQKYKSPSIDSGDKPKGFTGSKDSHGVNGSLINGISASDDVSSDNGVDILDKSEQVGLPNGNVSEISVVTRVDDNKEQEPKAGTSNKPKLDKQAGEAEKLGKSSNQETRKPRGFGKESSGTAVSTKNDDLNRNGNSKGKKGGSKKPARNVEDKFWWTRLPYVLAVLMQRSGNGEESEGFFTLKSTSETKNGLSHTVAFEDRGDATNFCYLLEFFFEDLGDFNAILIPIPTNELEEEVKSQNMNVVVVKKGQLQLYVGQPLTDVEASLRTLIDSEHTF